MAESFVNPVAEGSHVSVTRDGERYLWCRGEGEQAVTVWVSDRIGTFGRRHVVWTAPESGPLSRGVRPSELRQHDGRWYVYLSGHDGDDRNRLAFVLESEGADPLGPYTLVGPLATGEQEPGWPSEVWAADMVVLDHDGRSYALWSGWPGRRSEVQRLYVDELVGPTQLAGRRMAIGDTEEFEWERPDPRAPAINEAPRVLADGQRTFVVYSCNAAWLPSYKMGMLALVGADPTHPDSWRKSPEPVFAAGPETLGVGHASFVTDTDNQWWMVYDAKWDAEPDWRRAVYMQPLPWPGGDTPAFGEPVAAGEPVSAPTSTTNSPGEGERHWDFRDSAALDDFDYYGHHQFLACSDAGLDLGVEAENAVNGFRTGEKIVLRDGHYTDLRASVTLSTVSGERDVGLLFRTTQPALGFDAQCGYYAALSRIRKGVILGKMDGIVWKEIGYTQWPVPEGLATLSVEARGDRLGVSVDGDTVLVAHDGDYPSGSVGCRVVDTHGRFESLDVAPLR